MAQEPLHVLWVEPHFPGRLGAVADWLVRRRGYRCWFYCHTADPREYWPASVGQGLELQSFGVGGVAREQAVSWSRTLERSLCYSYGCWQVLETRRPRPIDLIVGRSAGLGSTLFAPVYAPAPPCVNLFDYYFHPRQNDLAGEVGADTPPTYVHWRRSANALELLDLENCDLAWTQTHWQRHLFPPEYRDDLWVQHDGIGWSLSDESPLPEPKHRPRRRLIAGRVVPEGSRLVSFIARSLDRLRGFDRFWQTAAALMRARSDVICVVVGDPVVQRGLDVHFHNRDYLAAPAANRSGSRSRPALAARESVARGGTRGSDRQRSARISWPALSGGPVSPGSDGRWVRRARLGHGAQPGDSRTRPKWTARRSRRFRIAGAAGPGRA